MELETVVIHRTDTDTDVCIKVRLDRIEAFKNLLWDGEVIESLHFAKSDDIPGISGLAALGVSTIFTRIPNKFPVVDLLTYLAEGVEDSHCRNRIEVEKRLEIMANRYPGIDYYGDNI